MAKMNFELLCYYLCYFFVDVYLANHRAPSLVLAGRAKKKINARLMVMCLVLFSSSRPLFMCKNKCAHKPFQFNVWRSGYYYYFFFFFSHSIQANISFDSYESVQMKHMHVNKHFRIISKLTQNEAFFLSLANETNEEWAMRMKLCLCNSLVCDSASVVPHFKHICVYLKV